MKKLVGDIIQFTVVTKEPESGCAQRNWTFPFGA